MNVFYLHDNPLTCARMHCDKHVVKMIIEYAQLLSTAHRMLDGKEYIDASSGRKIRRWKLEDPIMEKLLYKASHINHPSAKWARQSHMNYNWLYLMWTYLCNEYTFRYGKKHLTDSKLRHYLIKPPMCIRVDDFAPPPPAMPDYCKEADSITSYRKYYILEKKRFAKWKNAITPRWFTEENYADLQLSL